MTTVVNGITVFELSVRGTATKYIRAALVTPAADLTSFGTWETAAASVAGKQTVDMYPIAVAGNATGLANDATTYTCSINFDGVATPVSVVGSAAQTFTNLIAEIETDIGAAGVVTIVGGNLVVTSSGATGKTSYVRITDTNLFSSLTGFLRVGTAVDGGLDGYLRSQTLANGANAYAAYGPYAETYDTAAARVVNNTAAVGVTAATGTSDGVVADVGGAFNQATLNNNFQDVSTAINAAVVKINALQTELKGQTR